MRVNSCQEIADRTYQKNVGRKVLISFVKEILETDHKVAHARLGIERHCKKTTLRSTLAEMKERR